MDEVATYSQQDVICTYRLWLIHELFCARLSQDGYAASEESLRAKLATREALPSLAGRSRHKHATRLAPIAGGSFLRRIHLSEHTDDYDGATFCACVPSRA